MFSVEERVKILEKATADIPNVKVDFFSGLLIDYANDNDIHVAIRGLRAITDFEYELQIAQTNRVLSKERLDTMFFTTSLELQALAGIFLFVCRILWRIWYMKGMKSNRIQGRKYWLTEEI